jgi:hypothetical protein
MCRRIVQRVVAPLVVVSLVLSWATAGAQSSGADSLGPIDQPISEALLEELRAVSRNTLTEMPSFRPGPLTAIDDDSAAAGGTPLVLYIGADFCPYCAVLRWPLALTLMRFGELSGLRYTRSSSTDVYADTATFSLRDAQFDSEYLRFEAVELQDREGKTLERPDETQRELFLRLNSRGSIPFLYLGGKYLSIGSPFSPQPMQGLDWQQTAQRLEAGDNAVWQDVIGEANVLTAALCTLTNQAPDTVCGAPGIDAAAELLPD